MVSAADRTVHQLLVDFGDDHPLSAAVRERLANSPPE
jgi:hypothetical protein